MTSLFSPTKEIPFEQMEWVGTSKKEQHVIYFIRHGECEFNVPDRRGITYTQGRLTSIPLTEKGHAQAKIIGESFKRKIPRKSPILISSSTAIRAQDTASEIFKALDSSHCRMGIIDPRLLEKGKGPWEGKPKDEKFRQAQHIWKALPPKKQWNYPQVPGGETLKEVADRVDACIDDLINEYPKQTHLVVTHGYTMNAMLLRLHEPAFSEDPETDLPIVNLGYGDILRMEIPKGKSPKDAKLTIIRMDEILKEH